MSVWRCGRRMCGDAGDVKWRFGASMCGDVSSISEGPLSTSLPQRVKEGARLASVTIALRIGLLLVNHEKRKLARSRRSTLPHSGRVGAGPLALPYPGPSVTPPSCGDLDT